MKLELLKNFETLKETKIWSQKGNIRTKDSFNKSKVGEFKSYTSYNNKIYYYTSDVTFLNNIVRIKNIILSSMKEIKREKGMIYFDLTDLENEFLILCNKSLRISRNSVFKELE